MTAVVPEVDWAALEKQFAGAVLDAPPAPEVPTLTADLALQHLEAVVADAGEDFVYQKHLIAELGDCKCALCETRMRCYYLHPETGEPDCGVGRALLRHGTPRAFLGRLDVGPAGTSIAMSSLRVMAPWLTYEATQVLRSFQIQQDAGNSWGNALAAARERREALG